MTREQPLNPSSSSLLFKYYHPTTHSHHELMEHPRLSPVPLFYVTHSQVYPAQQCSLEPQNMTLFETRSLRMELAKMRSCWSRGAQIQGGHPAPDSALLDATSPSHHLPPQGSCALGTSSLLHFLAVWGVVRWPWEGSLSVST